jgi:hypothetical protein
MTDENKPREIDILTLDKFNLMVDNVLVKLEESKGFKRPEAVKEEITVLKEDKVNPDGNGLSSLTIIGETIGDMMVSLFDTKTEQYISIYSNATICAKTVGLNPTTIRQRASVNKIVNEVKWSYMTFDIYNDLIK